MADKEEDINVNDLNDMSKMAEMMLGPQLENVAKAAGQVADTAQQAGQTLSPRASGSQTIDYILDVTLQVAVEVGRARMTIQDLLQLGQGSVIELEKLAGEPLDIFMNGKPVAKGEAVIINEKFGVRITEVISRAERASQLG